MLGGDGPTTLELELVFNWKAKTISVDNILKLVHYFCADVKMRKKQVVSVAQLFCGGLMLVNLIF